MDAMKALDPNTGPSLENLHSYLLDLNATVEYAFSYFDATRPTDVNDYSTHSLPESIVESRASDCDEQQMYLPSFEKTDFIANVKELLDITDIDEFKSKYSDFDYREFSDTMISYANTFTECISGFKNYMNDFKKLIASRINCTKTHVAQDNKYIFEKESKVSHTQ